MGLDMHLTGEKYIPNEYPNVLEDGFRVSQRNLELGYWRKHPNLHGYIVNEFADGVDDCRDIDLSAERLKQLIHAVKDHELPHTEGFFFGKSEGSNTETSEDLRILEGALAWLENESFGGWRSVTYRASW